VIEKRILVGSFGTPESWGPPVRVLNQPSDLTKLAFASSCNALDPRLQKFISDYVPDRAYLDLAITPLGAFEAWGSNSNGDAFERMWIEPEEREWGHKTFETNTKIFSHHRNKQPEKSFGHVALSVFEPSMQRIEIIARLDRAKAEQVGSGSIITDLDEGKMHPVSMGCRVSWDVCSSCGNRARNTREYCDCLKHRMNLIEPDGTLICALNPRPLFFDLSIVYVPAAKESAMLLKLASALETDPFKIASLKSSEEKIADLLKRMPVVYAKVVHPMYRREKSMPDGMLDHLCGCPLPETLSTAASLGMVLRPREFQRIYLSLTGRPELSQELHDRHEVFAPADSPRSMKLSPEDISPPLVRLLRGLLSERSLFQPFVSRRVLMVVRGDPTPPGEELTEKRGSALDGVSEAYARYLNGLGQWPDFMRGALRKNGEILDPFISASFSPLSKVASWGEALLPALGIVIPTYLLAAKWREDKMRGENSGLVQSFMGEHPTLSALGLLYGYHRLTRGGPR
jgi:hypothetical protein